MSIQVVVTSKEGAKKFLAYEADRFTHLISIRGDLGLDGGPDSTIQGFSRVPNRIELVFDDVSSEHTAALLGCVAPQKEHIDTIIRFGNRARVDYLEAPVPPKDIVVLAHCAAGISRSTAAAYIFLLAALGVQREREAYELVMRRWPQGEPRPNPLMISLAKEALGMNELIGKGMSHKIISPYDIGE